MQTLRPLALHPWHKRSSFWLLVSYFLVSPVLAQTQTPPPQSDAAPHSLEESSAESPTTPAVHDSDHERERNRLTEGETLSSEVEGEGAPTPQVDPGTPSADFAQHSPRKNQHSSPSLTDEPPKESRAQPTKKSATVEPERPTYFAPPQRPPLPLKPAADEKKDQVVLPGDASARPLTLPQGTLAFEFSHAGVIFDSDGLYENTRVPYFALGLTSSVELGMGAPLRYDQGVEAWTLLDPIVHLAATVWKQDKLALGVVGAVLIPASTDAKSHTKLAVPLRYQIHPSFRMDIALEGELAFDELLQSTLRIPIGAILQANDWLYTGLEVAPDLGLTTERDFGFDARYIVGFTLQSRGRAHVDAIAGIFVENMGGGRSGHFSDGGGLTLALRFFPSLY